MRCFLIISLFFSCGLFGQTKKDTLTLNKFSVDKNDKAVLSYLILDGADVYYKIEGKNETQKWILLQENKLNPIVKLYTGKYSTIIDTCTLKLGNIKEVRLQFIEPKSAKQNNKTIIIH